MVKNWIILGDEALDATSGYYGGISFSKAEMPDWKNIALSKIKSKVTEKIIADAKKREQVDFLGEFTKSSNISIEEFKEFCSEVANIFELPLGDFEISITKEKNGNKLYIYTDPPSSKIVEKDGYQYDEVKEQKVVECITKAMINAAHNPKPNEELYINREVAPYVLDSEYSPSEIEHIGLFYVNMRDDYKERAMYWLNQVKDGYLRNSLLSAYYSFDEDDVDACRECLKYALKTSNGVEWEEIENYGDALLEAGKISELFSLITKIMTIGLHHFDATQLRFDQTTQDDSSDNFEYIETAFEWIEECKDLMDSKDIENYYDFELAYYYACTYQLSKAKQVYAKYCDQVNMEPDSQYRNMYEFKGLSPEEKKQRYEWFKQQAYAFFPNLIVKNQYLLLAVEQAFGYTDLPKRPHPKKGSFDWLYNQGEKSYLAKLNHKATELDYANMRAVAEAYRTGNGVRQNLRLADCWDEMAQP